MGYEGVRKGNVPSLFGLPLKHISLVTLVVQNSALILILYYSRTMPPVNGQRYISSTAVLMDEVFKLTFCLTVALTEIARSLPPASTATSLFSHLSSAVFTGDSWKLAVPATLYVLQNTLQYVAISNLEAAAMQVTYQFKILPTAIFSIMLLRRKLSVKQWAALAMLMLGVAVVQLPNGTSGSDAWHKAQALMHVPRSFTQPASGQFDMGHAAVAAAAGIGGEPALHKRSATYEGIEEDMQNVVPSRNAVVGVSAALCACTVAAFASTYFEKIIKDSTNDVSLWIRNVQLSMYSLFPALFIGVIFVDGETIAKRGFFSGYNWVVWTVIALQAIGGIVVTLCLYYSDNVTKSFATSISILLSLVMSVILFKFELTGSFLIGTTIVLAATYIYNTSHNPPQKPQPPVPHLNFEKSTLNDLGPDARGEFTLQMPKTPRDLGVSTSRPGTPSYERSSRKGEKEKSYFPNVKRDD